MTVDCAYVKKAVKRRPGYPIGEPAPMFLSCQCGAELDVPLGDYLDDANVTLTTCQCGRRYDRRGWLYGTVRS